GTAPGPMTWAWASASAGVSAAAAMGAAPTDFRNVRREKFGVAGAVWPGSSDGGAGGSGRGESDTTNLVLGNGVTCCGGDRVARRERRGEGRKKERKEERKNGRTE